MDGGRHEQQRTAHRRNPDPRTGRGLRASNHVPGFAVGVYHAGEQIVVAHGTANIATGAPMLEDTGFLFGSVTKVMTTTLVLQQLERGLLDLGTPVVWYLPEFAASPSS
ncbi:serine hydrolase [Nocardia sp. NPDC047654]|uniref:serine hydrolase n=1 Tax=Nocardia sp. NPDC047654 TaxID=3364314 RepID=UPI0037164761